jgi:oligopeptide/dipeptide ABC transporter ATP-binding protein
MIMNETTLAENRSDPNGGEQPLVRTRNIKKHFKIAEKGLLHAVDGVSFDVMPNETLGLVGESGCGKSTVGNLLMKLAPLTSGEVYFRGEDIFAAKDKAKKADIRHRMQMIFQDPYSSLNPRKTIRTILSEPFQVYGIAKGNELEERVRECAEMVGLKISILDQFPHELDGGKRQLVGIGRALALGPDFIVCDEPVSSLDVSVQVTIINILLKLQKSRGVSYLFISHDLSVVRHISQRIAVMYLGEIIELASTDGIFSNTLHPYSLSLLSAVPKLDPDDRSKRIILTGDVQSPLDPNPDCCRFAPRCWMAKEKCRKEHPNLTEVELGHCVACHYWQESQEKAKALLA